MIWWWHPGCGTMIVTRLITLISIETTPPWRGVRSPAQPRLACNCQLLIKHSHEFNWSHWSKLLAPPPQINGHESPFNTHYFMKLWWNKLGFLFRYTECELWVPVTSCLLREADWNPSQKMEDGRINALNGSKKCLQQTSVTVMVMRLLEIMRNFLQCYFNDYHLWVLRLLRLKGKLLIRKIGWQSWSCLVILGQIDLNVVSVSKVRTLELWVCSRVSSECAHWMEDGYKQQLTSRPNWTYLEYEHSCMQHWHCTAALTCRGGLNSW